MHIAIAGNIGSGKTTLTGLLSRHFNWQAHYEDVDDNPYLDDFYNDMQRWSFNLQIFFLNSRYQQVLKNLSAQSAKISGKAITDVGLAPLVGSMSELVTAINQLVRTSVGVGVFLCLAGVTLCLAAFWMLSTV